MTSPADDALDRIVHGLIEHSDPPDGQPRCGECGRMFYSDSHSPGCHAPAAIAALATVRDALERQREELDDAQRDVGIWQDSSGAYCERMLAAEAEVERLREERDALATQVAEGTIWAKREYDRAEAAEDEVERLERDNASLVLAWNAAEHARKGDNKFLLERAEAAEAEVRQLTEENQRTRDDWAALRSELNDRDAQLDDELEGRQLSEQAVKTLGAEVRRLRELERITAPRLLTRAETAEAEVERLGEEIARLDEQIRRLADSPPEAS